MSTPRGGHWGLVSCGALWLCAAPLAAKSISHFDVASSPRGYFVTEDPSVLPAWKFSTWFVGSYAHDPLLCRGPLFEERHKIIEHQVTGEVAGMIGLFDWVEVGGTLPLTYLYGPPIPDVPGACLGFDRRGVNTANVMDPRLLAKVRLTPWTDGFMAALSFEAKLPLAQLHPFGAGPFTGATFPSLTSSANVGYTSRFFRMAGELGLILQAPSSVGGLRVGPELMYGFGAEMFAVPGLVAITADVYGKLAPALPGPLGGLFASGNQFPMEALLGGKLFIGTVVLTGGVGTGVIPHYGSPDVRVFMGVGYAPRRPADAGDRDGDGILDADDDCPDVKEDFDGFEDQDGCPDPDNDKDEILDADDGCPNDPEDRDRWQDSDGCPDPDNDEDEILDEVDECPNDPETKNGFEDTDGCPDADPQSEDKLLVRVKRQKIEILDKVYFALDSDHIMPQSYPLLDNVASVLLNHQEIEHVVVEGHTDWQGSDEYNLDLSQRRAKRVRDYLVAAGVPPKRVGAAGYGERQPIDTNETPAGRSRNRRVEFIIKQEPSARPTEKPKPAATAPRKTKAPAQDEKGLRDVFEGDAPAAEKPTGAQKTAPPDTAPATQGDP